MSQAYDVIVVGARCAGSPTAKLLARRGHRVLLVDRATFPNDTISTHLIHPPWGRVARALGAARPRHRDRKPVHRHVCVRFWTVHAVRSAGDG
jgi:flavin-dependent dehydrogenase